MSTDIVEGRDHPIIISLVKSHISIVDGLRGKVGRTSLRDIHRHFDSLYFSGDEGYGEEYEWSNINGQE